MLSARPVPHGPYICFVFSSRLPFDHKPNDTEMFCGWQQILGEQLAPHRHLFFTPTSSGCYNNESRRGNEFSNYQPPDVRPGVGFPMERSFPIQA